MSGFLPSSVANYLTYISGQKIDFSAFGRTTMEKGIGSYTEKQKQDRIYIWRWIIFGTAMGEVVRECLMEEATTWSVVFSMLAGATTGFLYSHWQVSRERVLHRINIENQTKCIEKGILQKIPDLKIQMNEININDVIQSVITKISNHELANDKRANATMTLLGRREAMHSLDAKINSDITELQQENNVTTDEIKAFWQQDIDTLFDLFWNNKVEIAQSVAEAITASP